VVLNFFSFQRIKAASSYFEILSFVFCNKINFVSINIKKLNPFYLFKNFCKNFSGVFFCYSRLIKYCDFIFNLSDCF